MSGPRGPRDAAGGAGTPPTAEAVDPAVAGSAAGTSGPAETAEPEVLPGSASALTLDPALEPGTGAVTEAWLDPRTAAFFDLDNTVVQGASVFQLAKNLYRRGFFPTRVILKGLWLQVYFRVAGREHAGHIEDARNATLSFIEGHTVLELEEAGREVYEESIARRIWPGTRALAQRHLDAGEQVWLVTAAPIEMAGVIAARLGLTGALGSTAEHVDGVYTGRLRGDLLHGPAKADAVHALSREHGLDLSRCSAYSDSANDLPMLSLVGHPYAVNPDRRLRQHAESHGWQVREFRTGRRAARVGLLGAATAGTLYSVRAWWRRRPAD